MDWYSSLVLPFVFGLIGFVEPCSMGINIMFTSTIRQTQTAYRFSEFLVFMLVRASILACLGTSTSLLGRRLFILQSGIFVILGAGYVLIGLLMIFAQPLLGKLRDLRLAHWLGIDAREGSIKRLSLIAGFTIPACAIPLVTVLLGQSLLMGNLFSGFLSLFTFGIALTLPLAGFIFIDRGMVCLEWIAQKANNLQLIGGVVLVLIGFFTFYTSVYWEQAFFSSPN